MHFRHHSESDSRAIQALAASAFRDSEGEAEGALIGKLSEDLLERTEASDRFVFVACNEDTLAGVIFFTRMPGEQEREVYLLAPVAVRTADQGRGLGQGLIRYGIDELRAHGVKILVTYGDPRFYSKVGFAPVSETLVPPPFTLSLPHGWLAQSLDGTPVTASVGKCTCVPAFDNPKYW